MGLSLRIKVIGTTVLLLVFVIAIFSVLQVRMATGDLDAETSRLRELRTAQAEELGRTTVGNISAGTAFAIAENDYTALQSQIGPVVRRTEGSDAPIKTAAIYNERGEVLAHASQGSDERPEPLEVESLTDLKDATSQLLMSGDEGAPDRVLVTAPIIDRNGKRWGFARFEYDLVGLRADLEGIETRATDRSRTIVQRAAGLGALAIVLGLLISILQALAITGPIVSLTQSAQAIAGGDLSARAEVSSRDELGVLASSFNTMAERIVGLLQETAAKTALERELEVARIIQETLLPPPGEVQRQRIRFAGYLRSASICGGDFWTFADTVGDGTLLCVGDVTGHGVPSAMITAACKSGIDTLQSVTGGQLEVSRLMAELNKTIYAAAQRKFTMTFFALKFDPVSMSAEFSNAGHNFPILVRQREARPAARALVSRGHRLGDVHGSHYATETVELATGDTLCLFTDGITEYCNPAGEEFGEKRFRRALVQAYAMTPDETIQHVLETLSAFANNAVQEDDVTLVVAKVTA